MWLNRQLAERAHAEGRSELGIIQEALTRYFTSEGVEVMDTTVESGTTYEVVTHREVSAEANFWVFEIPALGGCRAGSGIGSGRRRGPRDHCCLE